MPQEQWSDKRERQYEHIKERVKSCCVVYEGDSFVWVG